jgi:hypothetical protein
MGPSKADKDILALGFRLRYHTDDQQAHPSYALLNVTPQCTII